MLPDRVSNPGPLTYESGALPIALRGPASRNEKKYLECKTRILQNMVSCLSKHHQEKTEMKTYAAHTRDVMPIIPHSAWHR